jgi:hypothetical protein
LPYSRCSFERIRPTVGALYATQKTTINDAPIVALEISAAARAVSVGLDRVSIPIEEPRGDGRSGNPQPGDCGGPGRCGGLSVRKSR